jgi:DNA-binding NtrC family response regulator
VADDDATHRRMVGAALGAVGLECDFAEDGEEALRSAAAAPPDLVLLDVRMPRLDGLATLRRLAPLLPHVPVVMVTAHGDVPTAVEAMKLGARDFLEKPVDIEELRSVVTDILDRPGPAARPAERGGDGDEPASIVGISEAMAQLRETVRLAARSDSTVLVRGESGTGKELVARAVHELSARARGPFVAVNCAAIAEGVLESELFGHERGAFTGADQRRQGRFELADGGTLFLDEIGELRPALQAKLLRALQERSFERVGGVKPVTVDIRVVAATNRDLAAELRGADVGFRQDLYFRLAVLELVIPPLRERREDILPTARALLARLRSEGEPPRLSAEVASALTLHDWPGNVRELSNVLERALLFAGPGVSELSAQHLPPALRALCCPEPPAPDEGTGVRPGAPLAEVERELIEKTLSALGGNRTRTAAALGLSRRALLYKLKRYGIG